jgi:hypothetical protein
MSFLNYAKFCDVREGDLYGYKSKDGIVWTDKDGLCHVDYLALKVGRSYESIFQLVKDHDIRGYQIDDETYFGLQDCHKLCFNPQRIAYLYGKTEEELEKQKKLLESYHLPKHKIISDVGTTFDGIRPGIKKILEKFSHCRYENLYILNRKSMGEGFYYVEYMVDGKTDNPRISVLEDPPKPRKASQPFKKKMFVPNLS